MTLLRSLVVVLALAFSTACGTGPALPDEAPYIEGTLTEFLPVAAVLDGGTRVVVRSPDPSHSAIVDVDGGTRIYVLEEGGRLRRARMSDLNPGDVLEVWTTGIELRSDPPQVFAERIHILE